MCVLQRIIELSEREIYSIEVGGKSIEVRHRRQEFGRSVVHDEAGCNCISDCDINNSRR